MPDEPKTIVEVEGYQIIQGRFNLTKLVAANEAMEAATNLHGGSILAPWVYYAEAENDECYFCSGIEPRHIPNCAYVKWEALRE
jgi:hypothetical protein